MSGREHQKDAEKQQDDEQNQEDCVDDFSHPEYNNFWFGVHDSAPGIIVTSSYGTGYGFMTGMRTKEEALFRIPEGRMGLEKQENLLFTIRKSS